MTTKKRRPTKRKPTKKKPTKKAAKKAKPKRSPRRAKKAVKTKAAITKTSKVKRTAKAIGKHTQLRRHAGVDYITDPDGRSIRYHWARDDRTYKDDISEARFREWSMEDRWSERREQYWNEIEARTLDGLQDKILRMRMEELAGLTEARNHLSEYLMPLYNKDGTVKRHPDVDPDTGKPHQFAGLPVFPLEMPRFDRFIKSLLDLDERVMLKRGEAITRTETIGAKTKVKTTALDPVGSLMNITPEEARALAKDLLRKRMGDRYRDVLDVPGEDATDGERETEEL